MNPFLFELSSTFPLLGTIKIKLFKFELAHYQDALFEQHNISCPSNIKHSVKKRRAEYFAGRYSAALALHQLGYSNVVVGTGVQRQPLWPSNVVGSISHSKNYAVATVAKQRDVVLLGIDVEQYLTSTEAQAYQKLVVLNSELALIQQAGIDYQRAIMAAFSAKEAYFKALHPLTNCYFEFLDTEIICVELANNRLVMSIKSRFNDQALSVICYLEPEYLLSLLIKKG